MTYNKFNDYIKQEVEKLDFDKMYDDIFDKNIYIPAQIVNSLRLVLYHCEIKDIRNEKTECLKFYMSLLEGFIDVTTSDNVKSKKAIDKLELLNIIQSMDFLINKKKSQLNLYI